MLEETCIFCKIVKGTEESYKLYRDDDVLVILDKYPVSRGHLLVLTSKHFEGVQDVEPKLLAKAWLVASALAAIYRKELGAGGVNVVTNSGRPAGQVIFHFHIHVIPRWNSIETSFWGSRGVITEKEAQSVISMLEPYINNYVTGYLRRGLSLKN
ncbi:MAG: HIT family protein [Desulfurococcales archaeon]|nr:HIT family protein [Desulfurococcales archaeon]